MNYSFTQYLLLGLLTLIFVGAITGPIRKLALKIGAVDVPNLPRKIQTEPVPYLGGVAIALGVIVATFASILIEDYSIVNFKIAGTVIIPALLILSTVHRVTQKTFTFTGKHERLASRFGLIPVSKPFTMTR